MAATPEVPGFRDLAEIGRGGFARVYRAHQDRFNRPVALKVLNLADPDERTRDRFERECRAMGELSWHPHVVAVYDSGVTEEGHLFLAMEHLEGGSFADGLGPSSSLAWPDAVRVGVEVAGALGAAHAAGTLHRDLKPENVLVGPFGEAKLSDFGIAAVEGSRRTSAGVASFTVAHVAPEVLRGQRADERTDVYGLASTLHTLLVGAPPFDSVEPDEPVATTMMRILDQPVPRLAPPVPDALADLLVRALAKDPAERPESAAALGEALQAMQAGEGLAVTPLRLARTGTGAGRRTPGAATVPADEAADEGTEPAGDAEATITATTPVAERDTVPDPRATVTVTTPPSDGPATAGPTGEPAGADPAPAARRRGTLLVGGVLVAAVVVIVAVALLSRRSTDHVADLPASGAGSFEDLVTGSFQTDPVGDGLTGVALTSDGLWVTQSGAAEAIQLDPSTGDELGTTDVAVPAGGVATTEDDRVWVTALDGTEVRVIDDSAGEVTDTLDVSGVPDSISAAGEDVWVTLTADGGGNTLAVINGRTRSLDNLLGSSQSGPSEVAATAGVVWIANTGSNTLSRLDPSTQAITTTIDLDVEPNAVAATDDAVWVVSTDSRSVTRLDPTTGEVVAVVDLDTDRGAAPVAIAATADDVWVVDRDNDALVRIDPATNAAVTRIATGSNPVAVTATDTDVWVADAGDGTLTHVDPTAFG